MWSDPIDELIAQFERLLNEAKEDELLNVQTISAVDQKILGRVLADAKRHRELENKTGKVGFEATK